MYLTLLRRASNLGRYMKKTKRNITIVIITVIAGLMLLAIFSKEIILMLPDEECYCQRCGSGFMKRGPFIMGEACSTFGGMAGDPHLYCEKHGHIYVEKYNKNKLITDWMFDRDSYNTEEEYRAALPYKKETIKEWIKEYNEITPLDQISAPRKSGK